MKTLILTIALVCSFGMLPAQESGKSRMYINKFTKSDDVSNDDLEKVRAAVISAVNKTERFEILDSSSEESITDEESRRSTEAAMHDETARTEAIMVKANNYVMDGVLTACTTKSNSKDGKNSFTCVLTYSITITDIANNTTVATAKFDHSPTGLGGFMGKVLDESSTAEGAKTNAINSIEYDIANFFIEKFPLVGTIYGEDFEVKKDKLEKCYINIGSSVGVKVGDYFKIYEVQTKVGKEIEKELGLLKVIEIVDSEIALCKVTKGSKNVKLAMDRYLENLSLDENKAKPLTVKSTPEPLFAF